MDERQFIYMCFSRPPFYSAARCPLTRQTQQTVVLLSLAFLKNASFPINCPRQKVLENDSKVEEEEEEEEVGVEEEEEEVGEEEEVEVEEEEYTVVASVFKWVLVLQYIGQFTQSCHEG